MTAPSIALKKSSGQVLIIVLLVMIVGLTTGLLLLGRTTTDVSLTNKIEESSRAFNAAEAGIEEAIYVGRASSPLPLPSGVSYQVSLGNLTAGTGVIFPSGTASQNKPITLGGTFTVWLVPHDDTTGAIDEAGTAYKNASMDICYTTGSPVPAIGVSVYYKDNTGKYRTSFVGFDSDATRRANNRFRAIAASSGGCGTNGYTYRVALRLDTDFAVNLTAAGITPLALRVRPYYAASTVAVIPAANTLPKQGNQIVSTGQSGQSSRKISVSEKYVVPAPFLDHALFNTGSTNLTK